MMLGEPHIYGMRNALLHGELQPHEQAFAQFLLIGSFSLNYLLDPKSETPPPIGQVRLAAHLCKSFRIVGVESGVCGIIGSIQIRCYLWRFPFPESHSRAPETPFRSRIQCGDYAICLLSVRLESSWLYLCEPPRS